MFPDPGRVSVGPVRETRGFGLPRRSLVEMGVRVRVIRKLQQSSPNPHFFFYNLLQQQVQTNEGDVVIGPAN